jgi:hypothetical protein
MSGRCCHVNSVATDKSEGDLTVGVGSAEVESDR